MTIRYQCPKCDSVLKIRDDKAGSEAKCPGCKSIFVVPQPEDAPQKKKSSEKKDARPEKSEPGTEKNEPGTEKIELDTAKKKARSEKKVSRSEKKEDGAKRSEARAEESDAQAEKKEVRAEKNDSRPDQSESRPEKKESPEPANDVEQQTETSVESAPKQVDETVTATAEEPPEEGDGFDAASFLMEDGPGAKASAGLVEKTADDKGPATDSKGRRLFTSSSASAAKRASMSAAAAAADEKIGATLPAGEPQSTTKDETRVKAKGLPEVQRKPLLVLKGAKKDLIRFAPRIGGFLVLLVVAFFVGRMFLPPGITLPVLEPVAGKVTVNEKPLAGVIVYFEPYDAKAEAGKNGPQKLRTASGVTDAQGNYSLYYIQGAEGAPLGKGRVWLAPQNAADYKLVPPEYASRGAHVFEVNEANRPGKFDIKIKPGQ